MFNKFVIKVEARNKKEKKCVFLLIFIEKKSIKKSDFVGKASLNIRLSVVCTTNEIIYDL